MHCAGSGPSPAVSGPLGSWRAGLSAGHSSQVSGSQSWAGQVFIVYSDGALDINVASDDDFGPPE